MATVCSWSPNDSIDPLVRHLTAGNCLALPTESTYELAVSPRFASQLSDFQAPSAPIAIMVRHGREVLDWMPFLSRVGRRLLSRVGGGAMTLTSDSGYRFGLFNRLDQRAQRLVLRNNEIAVRGQSHPLWREFAGLPLPLLSVPLGDLTSASEVQSILGDRAALIVDGGVTPVGIRPSIVRLDGRRCNMQFEGALQQQHLEAHTRCRILFVCTGNTCRSPMAAALSARLLADHLGCEVSDLAQHGYEVQSAGLAAASGAPASPDGIQVAQDEYRADLSQHRSQMATLDTLMNATHIFTMTASHWYALRGLPVQARLLSPNNDDIDDPIGGELADYQACARQIHECLQRRLPELLES